MKIIAFLLFLIISPIVILISICLFFYSSEKPKILFKQNRIGFNQKEFTIYKFKTMENHQVTKLGKYLRKGGIDEIPQLINIIKGEMSDEDWGAKLSFGIREIFELTKKLGGTISGEHGIGLVQKDYIDIVLSKKNISYQQFLWPSTL